MVKVLFNVRLFIYLNLSFELARKQEEECSREKGKDQRGGDVVGFGDKSFKNGSLAEKEKNTNNELFSWLPEESSGVHKNDGETFSQYHQETADHFIAN